ncbi:hypothetical protein, variant [Fonticula alba]|uniref:SEC7 domain-containing protein n=1 Tax=Fonticula alba TaxID=691883 RepID=A0A058ZEQ6_FONAL|nr:hypothetical protein, variant [Fonticula alba]KCV72854.1 hypothetical protein, variant [Fonticula alba]|eukprot:XP_009492555.1 hypothetical protein, variant [Fonticula alba]
MDGPGTSDTVAPLVDQGAATISPVDATGPGLPTPASPGADLTDSAGGNLETKEPPSMTEAGDGGDGGDDDDDGYDSDAPLERTESIAVFNPLILQRMSRPSSVLLTNPPALPDGMGSMPGSPAGGGSEAGAPEPASRLPNSSSINALLSAAAGLPPPGAGTHSARSSIHSLSSLHSFHSGHSELVDTTGGDPRLAAIPGGPGFGSAALRVADPDTYQHYSSIGQPAADPGLPAGLGADSPIAGDEDDEGADDDDEHVTQAVNPLALLRMYSAGAGGAAGAAGAGGFRAEAGASSNPSQALANLITKSMTPPPPPPASAKKRALLYSVPTVPTHDEEPDAGLSDSEDRHQPLGVSLNADPAIPVDAGDEASPASDTLMDMYLRHQSTAPVKHPHAYALDMWEGRVSRTEIGLFLGRAKDYNSLVLLHYTEFFDFSSLSLDQALRLFLSKFRLAGESQEIDRVMAAFSYQYFKQAGKAQGWQSSDTVHTVVSSLLLLNTDLHNKIVDKKMTSRQFVDNTLVALRLSSTPTQKAGVAGLAALSRMPDRRSQKSTDDLLSRPITDEEKSQGIQGVTGSMLKELYKSIKSNQIKVVSDSPPPSSPSSAQSTLSKKSGAAAAGAAVPDDRSSIHSTQSRRGGTSKRMSLFSAFSAPTPEEEDPAAPPRVLLSRKSTIRKALENISEVPIYSDPPIIEGLLLMKPVLSGPGVRAANRQWRTVFVRVIGFVVYIFRAHGITIQENNSGDLSSRLFTEMLTLHSLSRPIKYKTYEHIFEFATADGQVHYFDTADRHSLTMWVLCLNRMAAQYSAQPLPPPVGSEAGQYHPPLLPMTLSPHAKRRPDQVKYLATICSGARGHLRRAEDQWRTLVKEAGGDIPVSSAPEALLLPSPRALGVSAIYPAPASGSDPAPGVAAGPYSPGSSPAAGGSAKPERGSAESGLLEAPTALFPPMANGSAEPLRFHYDHQSLDVDGDPLFTMEHAFTGLPPKVQEAIDPRVFRHHQARWLDRRRESDKYFIYLESLTAPLRVTAQLASGAGSPAAGNSSPAVSSPSATDSLSSVGN